MGFIEYRDDTNTVSHKLVVGDAVDFESLNLGAGTIRGVVRR